MAKIRQQSINAKALKIVFLILNFRRYEAFQTVTVNNAIFLSDDQPSRHSDSIQGAKSSLCAVRAI